MEHVLKLLAQHWGLSPTHYWHLRLLCSLLLGPMLGILYLLLSSGRGRPALPTPPDAGPTMWIGVDGRLLFRR